ncbi:MAG TPA: VTT domain-containing protein [Candidatus Nanoarchaeia archaeon]|nr:VTT domain-containing protein [Candidatus Nanoarchaeia archaeon]
MVFDNIIIELLTKYQLLLVFLGSFFFGESVIISSGFLAAQGILEIPYVFVFSFLGTVISDSFWFYFGKFIFLRKKQLIDHQKYNKLVKKIDKITKHKYFWALLFIKFLYGTRILTIVYLSIRRLNFWIFTLFNSLGTLLWLTVILTIGWLAGKGFSNVILVFNEVKYLLISLVFLLILYRVVSQWITQKITRI